MAAAVTRAVTTLLTVFWVTVLVVTRTTVAETVVAVTVTTKALSRITSSSESVVRQWREQKRK